MRSRGMSNSRAISLSEVLVTTLIHLFQKFTQAISELFTSHDYSVNVSRQELIFGFKHV